jgi:hypothetical protein
MKSIFVLTSIYYALAHSPAYSSCQIKILVYFLLVFQSVFVHSCIEVFAQNKQHSDRDSLEKNEKSFKDTPEYTYMIMEKVLLYSPVVVFFLIVSYL